MATSQIGSPLLQDEDNGSYEKEGSPLNDDIFDILFPASPGDEETEEKNNSHIDLNECELGPEDMDIKQRNITQSSNKSTKVIENKTMGHKKESSKNESKDMSQNNSKMSEGKYISNLKETGLITEIEPVLPIDDELFFDFSDASLSDDENEKSFNKSNVSVSDFHVVDEVYDRKQSFQYSEEGLMLEIEKDKKTEIKNKSGYSESDKRKGKMDISSNKVLCNKEVKINKNSVSQSKLLLKNYMDGTENTEMDINNKSNKILAKKTHISVQIEKMSHKKNHGLKNVNDKEEEIELEIQSSDILDDISDDEISDISDLNKKRNEIIQDVKDDKVQKKEFTAEDGNKKVRLGQCTMRIDEPLEKKYDEIVIIGDERLPTLTSYKNVKIVREEGLELRNLKTFIKRCGLHHDISSKPLLRRMIVLCVGLNDLILKTVSRDCSDMRKGKDKAHKPCYLFRYASVRFDLPNQINSQVKEISNFLPASCDVMFYRLFLFDLDKINENLSLEHYRNYGHHATLSESDVYNNKKVHDIIINTNRVFPGNGFLTKGTSEYQERHRVDFMAEAKIIMVNNIKKIQERYSKQLGDENSLHDNNIGKDDLRWVLNRMNKGEVNSIKEALISGTSRDSQTCKKSINQRNITERVGSNVNSMEGNTRKGWHSPGRCISPEGWHPMDICRQKEKERREFHKKRKNMKVIDKNSRSTGRKSDVLSTEEKSRNSSRIDRERIYERTINSIQRKIYERADDSRDEDVRKIRYKQAKEKMERSSRTSGSSERSMPRKNEETEDVRKIRYKQAKEKMERISRTSGSSERSMPRKNEGTVKRLDSKNYEVSKKESPKYNDRYQQKSRSSSSVKVQEYDSTTSQALRNLAEVHDRSCKMYIDNPNAHPDYNKEYHVFYEAKSQKIREIGGDPRDYDFLPEWKYVWQIRSKELFREAWLNMKNQCIKMMEEKKISQEKKNTRRERIAEEDHRNFSKSSKRKRSSESKQPNYKSRQKIKERSISPPIEKRQKYEKERLPNIDGNLRVMTDKSQLEALIDEELKGTNKSNSTIDTMRYSMYSRIPNESLQASQKTDPSSSIELASPFHEENDMDNLGLEEVGESVMPFNLGKYVPESKECEEEATIETSDSSENVFEILMMLSKIGDSLGSLGVPIKIIFDKAIKEKNMNRSTINIFTDPDMTLVMQLISKKLIIAIENKNNSAIEKVIYQEVKSRVDGLLKVVEETFVEGLNVQHIAEKSLGMESSEIIKCIKSGLEISTSSSFSEAKLMNIYKAVKEKQFRYVESKANVYKRSGSSARAFPMLTTNFNEKNVSPTEIPFNLPTREKSNNTEKYDPFEEEYF